MTASRPQSRTVSVLLLALFLGGLATEAYGLHPCPHHHGTPPEPADGRVVLSGGDDGGPADADPHFCTCVGSCHGGAATPVSGGAPESAVPAAPLRAVDEAPAPGHRPRDRAAYLLPFPNGPPAS